MNGSDVQRVPVNLRISGVHVDVIAAVKRKTIIVVPGNTLVKLVCLHKHKCVFVLFVVAIDGNLRNTRCIEALTIKNRERGWVFQKTLTEQLLVHLTPFVVPERITTGIGKIAASNVRAEILSFGHHVHNILRGIWIGSKIARDGKLKCVKLVSK